MQPFNYLTQRVNLLPVITRELRAEARHSVNYWLRVLGAVTVFIVLAGLLLDSGGRPGMGGELFMGLHATMIITIAVLVPMMTADCIARERREGTLGLLFLTPLRPREIVIGKSVVHMFRAMTLLLCAFPVISIPLLIGGVAWIDIYTAFSFQSAVLLISLAAGITASSIGKAWGRTMLASLLLSVVFVMVFGWCLMFALSVLSNKTDWLVPAAFLIGPPAILTVMADKPWSIVLPQVLGTGAAKWWWWAVTGSLGLSGLILIAAIVNAGRRVAASWQDPAPSKRQLWWFNTFCTPQYWTGLFRRKMKSALERNPIGWLHQYSWSARLTKWGWCTAVVVCESMIASLGGLSREILEAQFYLGLALLIGMAFSSSGSFRRERETGALELILVTPISVRQMIFGRLFGVYSQFALALVVLALLWNYIDVPNLYGYYRDVENWGMWMVMANFFLVPMVGLYFSIRTKHFLVAFIWTLVYVLIVPAFLFGFLMLFLLAAGTRAVIGGENTFFVAYLLALFFAGANLFWRLEKNLTTRAFALAK